MPDNSLPPDPESHGREFQSGRLPPELREYYLQQLTEEEIARMIADLEEVQETGGLELSDFIDELEEIVNALEPPQ